MIMFFTTILTYTIMSSTLLSYGIGLENLYSFSKNKKGFFIFILKNTLFLIISTPILWFFAQLILKPLSISFFLPIISIVFLNFFILLFNKILPNSLKFNNTEAIFSYNIIFLIFFIAGSFLEALAIIFSSLASLFIVSYILSAINEKTNQGNASNKMKIAPLILVNIGFILTIFYFNF